MHTHTHAGAQTHTPQISLSESHLNTFTVAVSCVLRGEMIGDEAGRFRPEGAGHWMMLVRFIMKV